jgi:hypothetical protein
MAPAETRTGRLPEPVLRERCGAVLRNRTWRRAASLRPSHRLLGRSRCAARDAPAAERAPAVDRRRQPLEVPARAKTGAMFATYAGTKK